MNAHQPANAVRLEFADFVGLGQIVKTDLDEFVVDQWEAVVCHEDSQRLSKIGLEAIVLSQNFIEEIRVLVLETRQVLEVDEHGLLLFGAQFFCLLDIVLDWLSAFAQLTSIGREIRVVSPELETIN